MVGDASVAIAAPVGEVFDALLDVASYPDWLVGSRRVRAVDRTWPDVGSAFHHTVGLGLVHVRDRTEVVELEPPSRLVLGVHIGPFGDARARFSLRSVGGGAVVELDERPSGGPVGAVWWAAHRPVVRPFAEPLVHTVVWGRNALSLERFRELVERRHRRRLGHRTGDAA